MDTTKLAQLASQRKRLEQGKRVMKEILKAAEASHEYKTALLTASDASVAVLVLEAEIRADILAEFSRTGIKNFPGVTVKVVKKTVCTDQDEARKYVLDKAPVFALVDWKALEKEAKTLAETRFALPFFNIAEETQVQIASDLSQFEQPQGLPEVHP